MLTKNLMKIAILGSTSHIAKNLIVGLSSNKAHQLYLFARSQEKLSTFLNQNFVMDHVNICGYEEFENAAAYDVIINCIGIGNPQELSLNPFNVFQITEQYDNMILQYIQNSPSTVYINLSSGAAYGADFTEPATSEKMLNLNINNLSPKDYYGISKLNMEAKHRSLNKLKIVDLRVFGFFSSHIAIDSKFLITDVIEHIRTGETLYTSNENIIRDYVHPKDFVQLVELCCDKGIQNSAYDVFSLSPITKFEMLNYFAEEHGLKYEIKLEGILDSVTGSKMNYYSQNDNAHRIGYRPRYTSLQSIKEGYHQFKMRNN